MELAERMSRLGTETAFEVLAKAKALEAQGKEIIHLEIGEPDFDTPVNIRDAAKKALDEGWTHYGPANGQPDLRQVLADEISKTRGIPVDPDEVVVTPGAKPIMFFAMLALLNEGDEVIYPNPGFPIYESVINFLDAKAVPIPLREENAFRFDIDEFKSLVTDKTRMVIINSPQNPTGGVLEKEDLEEIANTVRGKNIMVFSDEVYSRIMYDGEFCSISSVDGFKDQTIILEGFSKTYSMTGWRLGWGVMPKDLAAQVTKLQINCNSCTCSFSQRAAIEAITGPQDDTIEMVKEFHKRRDVIVDGFNNIKGISCLKPKGAFYVFPNIKETGKSSRDLENIFLNEAGVASLSGTSFGKFGDGYLRFSYANSIPNINKALEKIDSVVSKF